MYLVDLGRVVSDADTQGDVFNATDGIWSAIYERMNPTETLWVVAPNAYRDGCMWPVAMAVSDYAREESGLILKNTITVHRWEDRDGDMESAYDEILFFVKDKRNYQFHKDDIRVAHVYEGNEWGGKREEGNSAYHDTKVRRYNPDGKDPGNVWLDEDRTQTDNQEVDEVEPIPLHEALRRCVLVGSDEGETVCTLWADDIDDVVTGEERVIEQLDATALREEVNE
ncbi:DNA methyltransferase [Natronobacterium texcoconense]|uniref:DNA methylase n=1 Tax=Natronobacterium texcoconense TaxID=1095778 RepID=A0A1H1CGE8_NATTX|nr:DNA methyltransferase [Natronobacterium texcoconense]SDQ62796.1 DNA methylase [Natronobacterium texcoconense]